MKLYVYEKIKNICPDSSMHDGINDDMFLCDVTGEHGVITTT